MEVARIPHLHGHLRRILLSLLFERWVLALCGGLRVLLLKVVGIAEFTRLRVARVLRVLLADGKLRSVRADDLLASRLRGALTGHYGSLTALRRLLRALHIAHVTRAEADC